MGIHLSTLLKYYKRPEIQEAILDCAMDKEVAVRFGDKGFGKRPDVLKYPQDILEFAKNGATSFHCSEELWDNPLQLVAGMNRKDLDNLRSGWDLVLDIDCKYLGYSKIAAELLVQALEYHGVKSIFIKFSGNHGFHITIPWETFPDKVADKETKNHFPEWPRKIAAYLGEMIKPHLTKKLLSLDNINTIAKNGQREVKEILIDGKLDPFKVVEVDTVLISSRHLYRMPYVFNEKSGLVSIPIKKEEIMTFDLSKARPVNVEPGLRYINRENIEKNESRRLFVEALDYKIKIDEPEIQRKKYDTDFEKIENALPESTFPPCIKKILAGLDDGRKRSLFILVNFFTKIGWDYDAIEERLIEWNKQNKEQLSQTLIKGQIRYHKLQKEGVLPPNCDNEAYYTAFRICEPDNMCKKIKNPVSYSTRKAWIMRQNEVKQVNEKEIKKDKS